MNHNGWQQIKEALASAEILATVYPEPTEHKHVAGGHYRNRS